MQRFNLSWRRIRQNTATEQHGYVTAATVTNSSNYWLETKQVGLEFLGPELDTAMVKETEPLIHYSIGRKQAEYHLQWAYIAYWFWKYFVIILETLGH